MKLIVQIPCYNEAENIVQVIAEIPRNIVGIDQVEVLIIDDGSTDDTSDIALQNGADHVVRHAMNRGLAAAFRTGFDYCRQNGADIVVNTDGDMQYDGTEIPLLIGPILHNQADVVIGDRNPSKLKYFSFFKRNMQKIGSRVVSIFAKRNIPDATSGFRAYSRNALYRLTIETSFSHSLETLIQAVGKGLIMTSIPVCARYTVRPSRLAPSNWHFIWHSIVTLVRVVTYHRPLSFYWSLAAMMAVIGGAPVLRFLWFFAQGDGRGHIQSLVIGGTLLAMGFTCGLFGVLAAQINSNRRLLEEINERLRGTRLKDASPQTKEKG